MLRIDADIADIPATSGTKHGKVKDPFVSLKGGHHSTLTRPAKSVTNNHGAQKKPPRYRFVRIHSSPPAILAMVSSAISSTTSKTSSRNRRQEKSPTTGKAGILWPPNFYYLPPLASGATFANRTWTRRDKCEGLTMRCAQEHTLATRLLD